MVKAASVFVVSSTVAYLVLAAVFAAFCLVTGHNTMEMLYGASTTWILSPVAGALGVWLLLHRL